MPLVEQGFNSVPGRTAGFPVLMRSHQRASSQFYSFPQRFKCCILDALFSLVGHLFFSDTNVELLIEMQYQISKS